MTLRKWKYFLILLETKNPLTQISGFSFQKNLVRDILALFTFYFLIFTGCGQAGGT